jgi:3-methyl-2-oxobutanoate hydroxymethyltransferase
MSTKPGAIVKLQDWSKKKISQQKISMITCYDYSFAKVISESSIDALLVGDSLAMTMYGHKTTVTATVEMMAMHTSAVAAGAPNKFLVSDLPFLSFRGSLDSSMQASMRLMQAGAQGLKIEGARGNLELIRHLVDSGVPIMGHLGLTPQSIHQLGGFKVQGKTEDSAQRILKEAKELESAGCFAVVLECVPSHLAKAISEELQIPTIGIGAGPDCDGQVLVLQDLLGMNVDFKPSFVRTFLDGRALIGQALNSYHQSVIEHSFPNKKESF